MNSLRKLLVTGLGTGYLPIAPGTWGSLAACLVFLAAARGFSGSSAWTTGATIALAVLASLGCVALGPFAERTFGGKDPSYCTCDEWAGQAIALIALPMGEGWAGLLIATGAAFVAFRVFDILKPPPARQMEKLPHGWGILADDLVAGVYANITAQLALRLAGI